MISVNQSEQTAFSHIYFKYVRNEHALVCFQKKDIKKRVFNVLIYFMKHIFIYYYVSIL